MTKDELRAELERDMPMTGVPQAAVDLVWKQAWESGCAWGKEAIEDAYEDRRAIAVLAVLAGLEPIADSTTRNRRSNTMPSNVPEARRRLEAMLINPKLPGELADEIREEILPMLRRVFTKKPAPPENQMMTPEIAREVREVARKFPSASTAAIGRLFRIGSGRVSEAIAGLR